MALNVGILNSFLPENFAKFVAVFCYFVVVLEVIYFVMVAVVQSQIVLAVLFPESAELEPLEIVCC